jgi:glycosyltransferase involved in cell wall biosynthesis
MANGLFFEETQELPEKPTRDDILNYFMLPLYPPYEPESYKVKGDKPLMLILKTDAEKHFDFNGRQYSKSPLADNFYKYLNGFEIVYETDPMVSVKEIVDKKLGGIKPDIVLYGYTYHYGILINPNYMKNNDIKFIFTIGDIECYEKQGLPQMILSRIKCDYLLSNLLGVTWELNNIKKRFGQDSITIEMPWSIDPNKYQNRGQERDIDVSFICSFDDDSGFHTKRKLIKNIVDEIPNSITGNFYGEEYIDILNRSKIFVVEPSERGALVQKYLEASSCGAMLIGEIPWRDKEIFEDGVTIGNILYGYYDTFLKDKILYYLDNPKIMSEIAKKCRSEVLKRYDVSKISKELEEILMNKTIKYGVKRKKTIKNRVVREKTIMVNGSIEGAPLIEKDPDMNRKECPISLPKDENLILIVDRNRERSPLLKEFQDRLCSIKTEYDLKFIKENEPSKTLFNTIHQLGVIPGYVFTGFNVGKYLLKNMATIEANGIKVISETGDPWLFNEQEYFKYINFVYDSVIAIVCHSFDGIHNITNVTDIPLIVSPWGMNKNIIGSVVNKRKIDVAWVCTCTSFKVHVNKNKVNKIIKNVEGINKIIGNIYGKKYYDILKHSKIFLVAGRLRDTMVQKYVEGAMCGALMIGEIPEEGRHILEGNMVEVEKGNYENLEDIILYYIEHEKERLEMTKRCQENMVKYRNIDIICRKFISELNDIIKE